MALLFAGGEDIDFTQVGTCTVNTATTAARRTANARCSLKSGGSAITDGWQASLSSAVSSCWLSAQMYTDSLGPFSSAEVLYFLDGTVRRLGLVLANTNAIRLQKRDAAFTNTTLATAGVALPLNTLVKLDMQIISYGASGTVNVYQGGTLILTYTGDLTTNSATTLSAFVLGVTNTTASTYWSEAICGTADTRSMSLVTLPPAANGNAFAWTNSYTSVNETTLDDATLCASATANQISEVTVTSTGITGTPGIVGVVVSGRAQKGGTGPANANLMVRTAATDYFSGSIALSASLSRISNIWETNPNTSAAWVPGDLTAAGFNVGIKSLT